MTLGIVALILAMAGWPTSSAVLEALQRANVVEQAVPLAGPVSHSNLSLALNDQPAFAPRFPAVNVSSNVSVKLVNHGLFNHTFTLSRVANFRLDASWTPVQLDRWFAQNGSLANVSLLPGASSSVNLTFNASTAHESFEFVSLVPYQFQAGMWGVLNVTGGPALGLFENTSDALMFVPNVLELNTTSFPVSVSVRIVNLGNLGHTWTIAPQPNVSLLPSNFTSYFAKNPPLATPSIPGGAGSENWANFTIRQAGVYEYICTISGHFSLPAGMFGYLYVDVVPPPPPTPPSTALVHVGILWASGSLLVVGAVLVAVGSLTGRFPPKKEPSRHP